jgi:hypothetical protein
VTGAGVAAAAAAAAAAPRTASGLPLGAVGGVSAVTLAAPQASAEASFLEEARMVELAPLHVRGPHPTALVRSIRWALTVAGADVSLDLAPPAPLDADDLCLSDGAR